jgi:RNA ligase (TIGR02306 family)
MSTFAVRVQPLRIETHPNADALELAVVGDFRAVVGKGQFQTGDLAAYIPEGAVLPPDLIAALGLTGRLAGPEHNRVSAVRLRGVLSQGLCVRAPEGTVWTEGQDVTDALGVTKYQPVIPDELLGEVYALEPHESMKFDLEDIKGFPHIFVEGEPVVFTEKVHGTFVMVVGLPVRLARPEAEAEGAFAGGRFAVTSKGLMHHRLAFQDVPANEGNVYLRAVRPTGLIERLPELAERHGVPVFVLAEVAGLGIQDLAYGQPADAPILRVFAGAIGRQVLDDAPLDAFIAELGLIRAPVLYRGPFSKAVLAHFTTGTESVSGRGVHLREGVVVTPEVEREDLMLGRVALKSVSEAYLLRKGGTEYN